MPLVLAGSVLLTAGAASIKTGASIADSVRRHTHHGPFVITETIVTAEPAPNKVIVTKNKQSVIQNH